MDLLTVGSAISTEASNSDTSTWQALAISTLSIALLVCVCALCVVCCAACQMRKATRTTKPLDCIPEVDDQAEPRAAKVAVDAPNRASLAAASPTPPLTLPIGWTSAVDPSTGRAYYIHNGQSQWEPPTGARPYEIAPMGALEHQPPPNMHMHPRLHQPGAIRPFEHRPPPTYVQPGLYQSVLMPPPGQPLVPPRLQPSQQPSQLVRLPDEGKLDRAAFRQLMQTTGREGEGGREARSVEVYRF